MENQTFVKHHGHRYLTKFREHISQTTGANYQENDIPRYATFTFPCLTTADVDRYGNPTVECLLHHSEEAFGFAAIYSHQNNGHPSWFIDWVHLTREGMIFTVSTKVHCSRSLYDVNLAQKLLDVKISLGGLGSTSLLLSIQFFVKGSTEPIFVKYYKSVLVHKTTHKPIPLPDWFRRIYRGRGDSSIPDCGVDRFPRPSNTFALRLTIVNSVTDIDMSNHHTNYTSYIRFGLDTLHLALYQKSKVKKETQSDTVNIKPRLPSQNNPFAVKWLTEEMLKQGVKSLEISFMKESHEGEIIDVHVWQEEDAKFAVKCSVEAMDKSVLSQFVTEYFTPLSHH